MKPGKPSETALRIAFHRVLAKADPVLRPLLADPDEPFSEWFVQGHSAAAVEQLARWRSHAGNEFFTRLGEKLDPGGPLFLLLRKRYVEDEVRAAVAAGVRQLVVVGGGYDTLALRLLREPLGLVAIELDHPQTQAVKRRVLEEREAVPTGLCLCPADLTRVTLEAALAEAGFDPARPAVFVAEGVIMYLDHAHVDELFAALGRLVLPGSRLVFSFVETAGLSDRESSMGRTARLVAMLGEPLRSSHDPAALADFLAGRGFRLRELVDHRRLRERYLAPLGIERPLRASEWLAVAERTPAAS